MGPGATVALVGVRRQEDTGITYLVSLGDTPLFMAQNILRDTLSLMVYSRTLGSRKVAVGFRAWGNRRV